VGFGLPLLAAWVTFATTGGAQDMLYWLVWRNVVYVASPVGAGEALERAASYLLPWLLAMAPLAWAWTRSRPLLDAHRRRLVDGLIGLGILAAFAGLRFYPHYFVPAAFALALGAAPAVAGWVQQPRERAARVFFAATAILSVGFQAANTWLYLGGSGVYQESRPVYRQLAERLSRDECFRGSRLFVWGWAPAFYYEAGLRGSRPASRFAVMAQAGLTGYTPGRRARDGGPPTIPAIRHWDWLMDDLERNRATYFLDTAPAGIYRWDHYPLRDYPRLERYVERYFDPLGSIQGVRIFRRRGCASADSIESPR
jgi:hypothetical protein